MSDKFLAAIAMISNDLSRWARARRAAADLETARNHTEHHVAFLSSHLPSLDSHTPGQQNNTSELGQTSVSTIQPIRYVHPTTPVHTAATTPKFQFHMA